MFVTKAPVSKIEQDIARLEALAALTSSELERQAYRYKIAGLKRISGKE